MRVNFICALTVGLVVAWANLAMSAAVVPGDDVAALAQAAPVGEVFVLSPGVYRTGNIIPKDGQHFIGQPGAVLSGAKVVDPLSWIQGPNFWVSYGHTEAGQVHGICNTSMVGNACRYPEELFLDNVQLQSVRIDPTVPPGLMGGQSGTWFFDYANDAIYVFDDPTASVVEMASLRWAFSGSATGVVIRGLTITRYANPAQHGAIHAKDGTSGPMSQGWLIRDCFIRENHGIGIKTGHTTVVQDTEVSRNGQLGIGGSGDHVLLLHNRIIENHTRGFSIEWEAGGVKMVQTNGLRMIDNWVEGNSGPGLWTDIDNLDTEIAHNTSRNNAWSGIFHEISGAAHIYRNYVVENAVQPVVLPFKNWGPIKNSWGWGAGILISASHDVLVEDNIVMYNGDGIAVLQQDRGPTHLVENVSVLRNLVVMLGTGADVGQSGLDSDHGDTAILTRNNVFDENIYVVDGDLWQWLLEQTPPESSGNRKWAVWQARGMDLNGHLYRRGE